MFIMPLCQVGLYNVKEFNCSSHYIILLFRMNLETRLLEKYLKNA